MDLDAPARAGNGAAPPSSPSRHRRSRRAADPGGGDGNGRTRSNGRDGNGGGAGRLIREGEAEHSDNDDGANGASGDGGTERGNGRSLLAFRRPGRSDEAEPAAPEEPAEDDWLGLDEGGGNGGGLQSFPDTETDTGGAPPRTPREGRNLARSARDRAARRRVEGRNRVDPDERPFESLLESQPQKSKAMRRATPLLDAVRDAVGGGV